MQYLDSGDRNPQHALGTWLERELNDEIRELRWQSGFFTADGLGFFAPTLRRLAVENSVTNVLIGSNDGGTTRDHILCLFEMMGIPRTNALMGVINYGGAYFHPKTYHFKRADGSQCAYVGSANLTAAGVASLHVEAGIILDTRSGDPETELNKIAAAVDQWFIEERAGLNRITSPDDVHSLVEVGIVLPTQPQRSQTTSSTQGEGGGQTAKRPRLHPLLAIPPLPIPPAPALPAAPAATVVVLPTNPAVAREGFPAYLLFDPDRVTPTYGLHALSGAGLPNNAVGLIIRLNRDSARHFAGRTGTANISIPVATLHTLKFGIFNGKFLRPRAEFNLRMRYLSGDGDIIVPTVRTNIMAYGFAEGETGHGDVRMVIPAAAKALGERIRSQESPPPTTGDFAFMEWPTSTDAEIKISFLHNTSPLFQAAQTLFHAATVAGQLVGDGACWLPPMLSPEW